MYSRILEKLNACGIGHEEAGDIGMNLLCGYHCINEEKYAEAKKKAKQLFGVFAKINLIYKSAIIQKDNETLQLFETGFLKKSHARNFHRRFFLNEKPNLPFILRVDSPDLRKFLEFQVGFRGLGYLHAFRDVISEYWGEAGLFNRPRLASFDGIITSALKENCNKIIFSQHIKQDREINYFLQKIFPVEPIDVKNRRFLLFSSPQAHPLQRKHLYPTPKSYYLMRMLRKRDHFLSLFSEKISRVIRGRDTKADVIEPSPNLLYEQKMPMAIIYDKKYRERFDEEERSIFPETFIIKKGSVMHFDGEDLSLQDIIDMPMKRRKFIVKYAGLNFQFNWGSKAVYRLKDISRNYAGKVLNDAVLSYEKYREPWIIQKDISCKESISYFDIRSGFVVTNENYKLYRPYFICVPQENKIDVLDIFVLFRNHYKVHAKNDCAIGLVSVNNIDER